MRRGPDCAYDYAVSSARLLSPEAAAAYLEPLRDRFAQRGKLLGTSVDGALLASRGAALSPGTRCDFAELVDDRGATFVDGDLVVDAWAENLGGVVFVRGDLVARSLFTEGTLVVAGCMKVQRLLGDADGGGTFVLGDAAVECAVLSRHHRFDVWGEHSGERVEGDAIRARLEAWGAGTGDLAVAREKLRAWAKEQGRLPAGLVTRAQGEAEPAAAPQAPEPAAAPPAAPAPRSETLVALAAWLDGPGPTQRELLTALKNEWLARITEPDRAEARRLIKRAINSKKLVSERDELLQGLE